MKTYEIPKDADAAAVLKTLTKAIDGLIKVTPVELFNTQKKDHFFQRVNCFAQMCKIILQARSKSMPVCVQYEGTDFFHASYLEVQLVDRKNTIVYAATTLDDN